MKVNIFYTLNIGGRIVEAPHKSNPFEVENMSEALNLLASGWEEKELNFGMELFGVRVEDAAYTKKIAEKVTAVPGVVRNGS